MKTLARLGALSATLAMIGLLTVGTGVAAADSMPYAGPGSYNMARSGAGNQFMSEITNNNNVNLANYNRQTAITGTSVVNPTNNSGYTCKQHGNYKPTSYYNKKHHHQSNYMMAPHTYTNKIPYNNYTSNSNQGGSATSGNATNNNSTEADVTINNSAPGMPNQSVPNYSNYSNKTVRPAVVITRVTNNNTVSIDNSNSQFAQSGAAVVSGNTSGGTAVTGNATNNNSTDFAVSITNDNSN